MSAIKIKERSNIIIDFTKIKINSSRVYKSLRTANVVNYIQLENKEDVFLVKNEIKINDYTIRLVLPKKSGANKLKDYGCFGAIILENKSNTLVNVSNHKKFKKQRWANKVSHQRLRIKDLLNIILYCNRLCALNMFL